MEEDEGEEEGSSGIYSGNFKISSAGKGSSSGGKEESNGQSSCVGGGATGTYGDSTAVAAGRVSPLSQGQRNLPPRQEYKGRSFSFHSYL